MNNQQVELSLLLWILINHLTRGSTLNIHTAQQTSQTYLHTKLSSYGYEVGTSNCIVFEFKGCHNAFIALMQEDDDNELLYEIIIGGWANTISGIRKGRESWDFQAKKYLSGVVVCNEYRKFKVGWKDGNITAYRWVKPCQWEVLMSWHNTQYSVNYIGVTTGIWANGDWIIANEVCHEPINRNTLWKNGITRKDIVFSAAIFIRQDIHSSHQCAMQCQRYSDCCYYTYNGKQRDCRGFTETGLSTTSVGTQLWIRY